MQPKLFWPKVSRTLFPFFFTFNFNFIFIVILILFFCAFKLINAPSNNTDEENEPSHRINVFAHISMGWCWIMFDCILMYLCINSHSYNPVKIFLKDYLVDRFLYWLFVATYYCSCSCCCCCWMFHSTNCNCSTANRHEIKISK